MLKLAERLLGDRALAEDTVQDAFISAFRGLDKFEGRSSLKTWLHRIIVNAALTKLRQSKRRAEQSVDEYQPEFDRYDCRVEARLLGETCQLIYCRPHSQYTRPSRLKRARLSPSTYFVHQPRHIHSQYSEIVSD